MPTTNPVDSASVRAARMGEAIAAGATVAIVPCTNQKSDTPGPARDVWIGHHFQLVLAHAEMFYDNVFVMSYKYGFIDPDFRIEPYDIDIKTAKAADKLRWWFNLREDIRLLASWKPLLVALYTGDVERDRIIREFARNDVRQVILPFEGLSIGKRMAQVYDCEAPFDREKAEAGAYAVAENFGEADGTSSGQKYLPPDTHFTDDVEWE
jgi:hypothetical protein